MNKTFLDGSTIRSTTSKECIQCGGSYFPKVSSKDTSRFCSNKCSAHSRQKRNTFSCKHCKKEFVGKSCVERVFCSKDCKSRYETVNRDKDWIDKRKRTEKKSRIKNRDRVLSRVKKWAMNNKDKVLAAKRKGSKVVPKWYVAKAIRIPVEYISDSFYESYKSALKVRRLLKEMRK